jgi:hypothetical protein
MQLTNQDIAKNFVWRLYNARARRLIGLQREKGAQAPALLLHPPDRMEVQLAEWELDEARRRGLASTMEYLESTIRETPDGEVLEALQKVLEHIALNEEEEEEDDEEPVSEPSSELFNAAPPPDAPPPAEEPKG